MGFAYMSTNEISAHEQGVLEVIKCALDGRLGSSLVSGVELEVDSESQVVAPRLSSSVSGVAWACLEEEAPP